MPSRCVLPTGLSATSTHALGEAWRTLKMGDAKVMFAGGTEASYGSLIGTTDDMGLKVISAVGNYGEMYDRNVGRDSPLKIERGLNRLWSEGGLMYAPPVD